MQIKYEVSGKVHSVYRRSHGPDGDFHKASGDQQGNPGGASAWEKEGAKFNAFELMSGCWRSKQSSGGAPNAIATDFQIFATEAAYFDRSSHPGWAFCNYDDCSDKGGNEVGFPRDCGPAAPGIRNQWHQFVSLPPATSRMQPLACNLLERLLQLLGIHNSSWLCCAVRCQFFAATRRGSASLDDEAAGRISSSSSCSG